MAVESVFIGALISRYPYLGRSEHGDVVLFYSERTGTCVSTEGTTLNVVGTYSTQWDYEMFPPLSPSESITLRNV